MTQVVHKIQTPCRCGVRELVIPFGAEWLDIQLQDGVLSVWYRVNQDDNAEAFEIAELKSRRRLLVVHTGESFQQDDWCWFKTIQHPSGLVFHLFVDYIHNEDT